MGATSLGGPPVLLYLLSTPARAESNRANIITYFALTSVYLIVVLMVSGVYTQATLWRAGLVAPFFLGAAGSAAASSGARARRCTAASRSSSYSPSAAWRCSPERDAPGAGAPGASHHPARVPPS